MIENKEKKLDQKKLEEELQSPQAALRIKTYSVRPHRSVEAVRSVTRTIKNEQLQQPE